MVNRRCGWLTSSVAIIVSCGCVEQRFVVVSDPPEAKVYLNNKPVGYTPVDVPFIYYGAYQFRLERDGYETINEVKHIAPPWYSYPPIDFLAENIYPFKASDIQRVQFQMTPTPTPNLVQLRADANELRTRGMALPPPSKPVNPNTGRPEPPPPANPWATTVPPPPPPKTPPLEPVPAPLTGPPQ
jgi:hypothetical protein